MNALKKSSELWHSSSSRKGRPRIAPFQYYSSKDHAMDPKVSIKACVRGCLAPADIINITTGGFWGF